MYVGSSADDADLVKCGDGPSDTKDVQVVVVECATPLQGQYVVVKLPGRKVLTLCEIQVYAGSVGRLGMVL